MSRARFAATGRPNDQALVLGAWGLAQSPSMSGADAPLPESACPARPEDALQ